MDYEEREITRWKTISEECEKAENEIVTAQLISSAVNVGGSDKTIAGNTLCEDSDSGIFLRIAMKFICNLAEQKYFDGRNEIAVKTCSEIVKKDSWRLLVEAVDVDGCCAEKFIDVVADKMANDHRTLQQSFCGVCFAYMVCESKTAETKRREDIMERDSALHKLVSEMDSENEFWVNLPLI